MDVDRLMLQTGWINRKQGKHSNRRRRSLKRLGIFANQFGKIASVEVQRQEFHDRCEAPYER